MGCACWNKNPQPSVIPLYYLYRVGVASFHFEQSSRPQHSLQDPGVLEYLVSDVSRHHTGARLGAFTPLYICVLISVGIKCTHIVQTKSGLGLQAGWWGDWDPRTYHSHLLPQSLLIASSALKADITLGIARRLRGTFTPFFTCQS